MISVSSSPPTTSRLAPSLVLYQFANVSADVICGTVPVQLPGGGGGAGLYTGLASAPSCASTSPGRALLPDM